MWDRPAGDTDDLNVQLCPFGIGELQFFAGNEVNRSLFAVVDCDVRRVETGPVMGVAYGTEPALQSGRMTDPPVGMTSRPIASARSPGIQSCTSLAACPGAEANTVMGNWVVGRGLLPGPVRKQEKEIATRQGATAGPHRDDGTSETTARARLRSCGAMWTGQYDISESLGKFAMSLRLAKDQGHTDAPALHMVCPVFAGTGPSDGQSRPCRGQGSFNPTRYCFFLSSGK